ncbi:MAG: zinc ABC transporter substrate-binding protein [Pseudomonadota bacterium]
MKTTVLAGLALLVPFAAQADDLKVVASFSILGDIVENVGGDAVAVTTIVGPDADAHIYQPNAEDALAVTAADVIFVNGMGFETWSDALIQSSGADAPVFVATAGVTPLLVDGEVDPHAWNALPNGYLYALNVAKGLSAVDPDNATRYAANAAAYIETLADLHGRAITQIAAVPEERRVVVTAHDAFGYLASAYDLTFLAPVGIDTEAEPSARELASLIDQIKARGVAALFVENITNPDLVNQIAAETGLNVGGRIYSDALSERGGPATSYLAMFEHNLGAITGAIQATE